MMSWPIPNSAAPKRRRIGVRAASRRAAAARGNRSAASCRDPDEPRPFTDKQIELVETFADQAVIAIENVRLFDEVQAQQATKLPKPLNIRLRPAKFSTSSAGHRRTAQPVFDAIVESAARLCEAVFSVVWRYDGDLLHYAASHNFTPEVHNRLLQTYPKRPDRSLAAGRAILDGTLAHVPDLLGGPRICPRVRYGRELARLRGGSACSATANQSVRSL